VIATLILFWSAPMLCVGCPSVCHHVACPPRHPPALDAGVHSIGHDHRTAPTLGTTLGAYRDVLGMQVIKDAGRKYDHRRELLRASPTSRAREA